MYVIYVRRFMFTFYITAANFVNLMLEYNFNSDRRRIFFNDPQHELNIQSRQVLYRF